jgi:hypothetical protein
MRRYADAYYVQYAPEVSRRFVPILNIWRDYRATVLAVIKSGEPAGTVQRRHGVESILVTFRDWITPWLHLDYLDDTRLSSLVGEARQRLIAKVGPDYMTTAGLLRGEVTQAVGSDNLIAKLRDWRVMDQALDGLTVTDPPAFLPTLVQAMQQGVRMQQSLENAQASAIGLTDRNVAFSVFTDAATRADTNVSTVVGQVSNLQQQVTKNATQLDTINSSMSDLRTSFSAVNSRVDTALAEGGTLTAVQNDVSTIKSQVTGLQQLNPTDVTTRLSEVTGLSNRLAALEQKIG